MSRKGFSTPLAIIIVLLIAAVAVYFVFVKKPVVNEDPIPDSPVSDSDETTAPLLVGDNAIYVSDAKPAINVKVGFAVLAEGGYVVIHEDREAKPGAIVGNSNLLHQGESRDLEVTLSRESIDGETLYAMLHSDNGDDTFNPEEDPPIKDGEGNIVLMKFQVSSSAEEPSDISL